MMQAATIVASVLNWNDAASTLECVAALQASQLPEGMHLQIVVLDNGSGADDFARLRNGLTGSTAVLVVNQRNKGFAGGHNQVIAQALQNGAGYLWLVNNDALVAANTLQLLLAEMLAVPRCGVVSPLIFAKDDSTRVDFAGAYHDWGALESVRAANDVDGRAMQANHPNGFFVYGTAPLIKAAALQQCGLLAEDFFAYFEDDDFCVRLSESGWRSRLAFGASIYHVNRRDNFSERQPYYFYLMARNGIRFYLRHTPTPFRRLIRTRLATRGLVQAALLRERKLPKKADACLLGIWHGLMNRGGQPVLAAPPVWMRWLERALPYRLQQWLA